MEGAPLVLSGDGVVHFSVFGRAFGKYFALSYDQSPRPRAPSMPSRAVYTDRDWRLSLRATVMLLLAAGAVSGASTVTLAGTGVAGFSGDQGPGTQAQINNPYGLTTGPDG